MNQIKFKNFFLLINSVRPDGGPKPRSQGRKISAPPRFDGATRKIHDHILKYPGSRELQSILQDPQLNSEELRYLRSHALKSGDLKAYHIAGLSLATGAERISDFESVRRHAREAIRAFREDFLDPRRERISEALLSSTEHLKQNFTTMELRLLKLLERGPRSKADLISEAYGRLSNYACEKSVDSRFRTLLYRLNKKVNGLIVYREGIYQIKCD